MLRSLTGQYDSFMTWPKYFKIILCAPFSYENKRFASMLRLLVIIGAIYDSFVTDLSYLVFTLLQSFF
jgi:hypothetical protein